MILGRLFTAQGHLAEEEMRTEIQPVPSLPGLGPWTAREPFFTSGPGPGTNASLPNHSHMEWGINLGCKTWKWADSRLERVGGLWDREENTAALLEGSWPCLLVVEMLAMARASALDVKLQPPAGASLLSTALSTAGRLPLTPYSIMSPSHLKRCSRNVQNENWRMESL